MSQLRSDDWNAYWWALGRFAESFATIETALFLALIHYSGVSHEIASAIFSGVRIEQTMSFINRITEVVSIDDELKNDLTEIFAQLTAINKIRNDLIHHGTHGSEGGSPQFVTNQLKAHTESKVRKIPMSANILEGLTHDLGKIHAHFIAFHVGLDGSEGIKHPNQEDVLKSAWRYKRP